jgi:hypothetical protein
MRCPFKARLLILMFILFFSGSKLVFSQSSGQTNPPTRTTIPRTAWDNKPNFTGVWAGPGFSGKVGPNDTEPNILNRYDPKLFPPFTSGGEKLWNPGPRGDLRLDDPLALCIPVGIPRLITGPFAQQFVHAPGQIIILYEWFNNYRIVPLGAPNRPHMPYREPGLLGDSIGWWEGDTLVIDTVNLYEGTLDETVTPHPGAQLSARWHSDSLHLVERIRYTSPTTASYEITYDDPKVWTKPFVAQHRMTFHPTWQLLEYVCEENNRCREGKCRESDVQKSSQ